MLKSFFLAFKANMKIIFGGRFIWFLITSFGLFAYFMTTSIWQGELPSDELIYGHLLFPAILLVFYPSAFGIQGDADARLLELLFGIPGYMYRVWLARLVIICLIVMCVVFAYGSIAYLLVYPITPWQMTLRLMPAVLFVSGMCFWLSTVTRNGNATALLAIVLSLAFIFLRPQFLAYTMWDIALNPYELPDDIHPVIWQSTVMRNRLFLVLGSVSFVLMALIHLQKREKFI